MSCFTLQVRVFKRVTYHGASSPVPPSVSKVQSPIQGGHRFLRRRLRSLHLDNLCVRKQSAKVFGGNINVALMYTKCLIRVTAIHEMPTATTIYQYQSTMLDDEYKTNMAVA